MQVGGDDSVNVSHVFMTIRMTHLSEFETQCSLCLLQYFYSIKDISVGGRCVCNGHADVCNQYDIRADQTKLVCECQHNTCGDQCQECCPGFVAKPWRPATPYSANECESEYAGWPAAACACLHVQVYALQVLFLGCFCGV